MRLTHDGCGCFPTGRHYPGIAHLLKVAVRGLVAGFDASEPWQGLPIAMIDVETTGRDAQVDRIVELGIVTGTRRFNWLINPGRPIPADATAIHGITDVDVASQPRFIDIAGEVAVALEGTVPAAYNASFDKAFVTNAFALAGVPLPSCLTAEWLDPLVWARDIHSDARSRKLGEVAARLGIDAGAAHRASDDAATALQVMTALGKDARVPCGYGAMVTEQRRLGLMQADARRGWRK